MSHDEPGTDSRRAIRRTSIVFELARRVRVGAASSTVYAAGSALRSAVRNAWLYRWLTSEPEPEVVVVDLRETLTLGPMLGLTDRILAVLARSYPDSRVRGPVSGVREEIRRRPIRMASAGVFASVSLELIRIALLGDLSISSVVIHVGVLVAAGLGLGNDQSVEDIRERRAVRRLREALEPPGPREGSDELEENR